MRRHLDGPAVLSAGRVAAKAVMPALKGFELSKFALQTRPNDLNAGNGNAGTDQTPKGDIDPGMAVKRFAAEHHGASDAE